MKPTVVMARRWVNADGSVTTECPGVTHRIRRFLWWEWRELVHVVTPYRGPIPSWPRPGPQIPARRCEHAASGCNYPEGDCAGLCLTMAPVKRTGWEVEEEVEGVHIRIAGGDQALCEGRNRASFFISSEIFPSTLQEYFDAPESLEKLAAALQLAAARMRKFTA